ncbi:MAG: NUDIX hydrolase [Verrucomicrobiota bacterium]|nr:NUDIX hydrolase [Verrucomicrobiota bacterium]
MSNSKITGRNRVFSGKWLLLEELLFTAKDGNSHIWESVSRTNETEAVAIIATLHPSNRILLIRQYRPPAEGYVIELPAGLIEQNENIIDTAVREVYEETGYTGEIKKVFPMSYSSPGFSDESVCLATMEIDETLDINKNVSQNLEITEDIEVLKVERNALLDFMLEAKKNGNSIDAKLFCIAYGMSIQL